MERRVGGSGDGFQIEPVTWLQRNLLAESASAFIADLARDRENSGSSTQRGPHGSARKSCSGID